MSIKTGLLVICVAVFVLIGGSLYVASYALRTEADVATAETRRNHSYKLADELRQSSDDLTRMARLYVVTGEARYKTYFEQILAIRDGKAPRPLDYGNVYWDFVIAWGKPPRRDGDAVALELLMREAQFTDDELALLQQAKHRSDALVALESRAMHAVEGRFVDAAGRFTIAGRPDMAMASRLMHGPEYHRAKAEIMTPIHDFLGRVESRTTAEVAQLRRHGQRLNLVVIFGLSTVVVLVLVSFILVARYPFADGSARPALRSGDASTVGWRGRRPGLMIWTAWPVLAAALAACGSLLVVSWWLSETIGDQVREGVRSGLAAVHYTTARSIEDWLTGLDGEVRAWARSPLIRSSLVGHAARPSNLLSPLRSAPSFAGYLLLDQEGRIVDSEDARPPSRHVSLDLGRILVAELRASPQSSIVVFPDESPASLRDIVVAAGVPDKQGGIDGALVLRLDPRLDLSRMLQRGRLGESGETYAFNRSGRLISESRFHAGTEQQPLTQMTRVALDGRSGIDLNGYRDARGVPVIGAWTWNERYGIGIATEVALREAYGVLEDYLSQTRMGTGLSVMLILGLSGVFAWNRLAMAMAGARLETAYEIIRGHHDRMEEELNVGRDLQLSMVPSVFPAFPGRDEVSVHAVLRPAREVAGDFYDFYFVDATHVFFCVGDVSDKGVAAALFMAVTKTLIKARTTEDPSPASVVTYLNAELCRNNDRSMFVTLFVGLLDVATGELVYTNAGHEAPYVRGVGGSLHREEERHGPLVGLAPGIVYSESRRQLAPGDLIVIYTDGVTDAQATSGRVFSEAQVAHVVGANRMTSTRAMVDGIIAEVETFTHGAEQTDDITVLALQFMPGAGEDMESPETLVIHNYLSELDRVDVTVERFGKRTGLPAEILSRIRIACDEVMSNIIAYAFPHDGEHDIEISLAMVGRRLVVRVSDDGIPFDPLTVPPPDLNAPLAERQVGGVGIHVVRNLFDQVTYERRGDRNILTLASKLTDAPGAPERPDEHDTTAQGG